MRKKAKRLINKVAKKWNMKPDDFKEIFKKANHIEKGKMRRQYD